MNHALLALEDGTLFRGRSAGAAGTRTGEVVFNTSMTGYPEIFTDPSYCGQIVTMTFPLIGNYGLCPRDFESARPHLSGVVLKQMPRRPSSHRAELSLGEFLRKYGIVALAGIDTRALTRRIRKQGALRGVLSTEIDDPLRLVALARQAPGMTGANLVERVSRATPSPWPDTPARTDAATPEAGAGSPGAGPHIVVIDCGLKSNIARLLAGGGARVTLVPATTPADRILGLEPDGLVAANGPGDPAAVEATRCALSALLGRLPILGICLGHQLLALALGAQTYKLRFGHHGGNLPVRNIPANRVEITSQNHGFAVRGRALETAGATVTHVNLNDDSIEGFAHPELNIAAVQFHPEAAPGPHDAGYLLARFVTHVREKRHIDTTLFTPQITKLARASVRAAPPKRRAMGGREAYQATSNTNDDAG